MTTGETNINNVAKKRSRGRPRIGDNLRKTVSITIDEDLWEKARGAGLNISGIVEWALTAHLTSSIDINACDINKTYVNGLLVYKT